MRNTTLRQLLLYLWICMIGAYTQVVNAQSTDPFQGEKLYADVKKYVSFGVHRTAAQGDIETSTWIQKKLEVNGFQTSFTYFPVKQFFLEKVTVDIKGHSVEAFPLWYVKDPAVKVKSEVVDLSGNAKTDIRHKVALVRLPPGGQITKSIIQFLDSVVNAGAQAIIAISTNKVGEIVAYNTTRDLQPWKVPVVIIAPKDSVHILKAVAQKTPVTLSIKGTIKAVQARSIIGKIGSGKKYVIISTPISGWFTCGGERGPGVAIFNALAEWISKQNLPYTFLFTANSGHELDNTGAHVFIGQHAPKPEDVYLWLHLGAGIATREWKSSASGGTKLNTVDSLRNIMYSENMEASILAGFEGQPGKRWKVKDQALGELSVVSAHGYKRFFGIAYGHTFHHMPSDDETTTSPQLLEEIAHSIQKTLELELQLSK
ncbi:hypothetical protein [Xanthocytophaga agilis]|nr:hypothetical protein [Xanthocytophaga agilis]